MSNNSANTTNTEPGILNKLFRRRSSAGSRKSEDLSQHRDTLKQYLGTHRSHSRSNSSSNPCYRLSFQVGVCENKNTKYRPTMEDVHTYVANFAERLDWGYFGVFDGHAGKQAARWCGSNLHAVIEKNILKNDAVDLRINLNNSFIESDELMKDDCKGSSGCTAAVAVVRWEEVGDSSGASAPASPASPAKPRHPLQTPFDFVPTQHHRRMLYTANVGDSRLVLSRNGTAVRLSYDHKGSDQLEQDRIVSCGGVIVKSRVNGMLAVTRSLGDIYMKDLVIGNPYTTATEITDQDEFLVIACDGLWDVCTDQHAVDMVRDVRDVNRAAKILCNYAMDNMTTDNVTVMVVRFDPSVFGYSVAHESATAAEETVLADDNAESDAAVTPSNSDSLDPRADNGNSEAQDGAQDHGIANLSLKD